MRFIRDQLKRTGAGKDVIGLDIGCSAITCVVLEGSEFSYKLKHYGVEVISPEIKSRGIKASEQVITCIKRLLAATDVLSKHCAIALPDSVVTSQWIRIDCSAAEDIEIAVNLALEQHVPHPLDDIYSDYQVFDSPYEDKSYLDVFLVACRKEQVDVRLQIIQQANLIPLFIEINSYAIKRAYTQLYPEDLMKTSILVDIGFTHLTLSFFGEAKQIRNYSESMINRVGKEAILQRVQQCLSTLYFAYPYYKFSKLVFTGSNYPLLAFLVKKLTGLYELKIEILSHNNLLRCADDDNKKDFITLFPALFLSFGLALRGLTFSM